MGSDGIDALHALSCMCSVERSWDHSASWLGARLDRWICYSCLLPCRKASTHFSLCVEQVYQIQPVAFLILSTIVVLLTWPLDCLMLYVTDVTIPHPTCHTYVVGASKNWTACSSSCRSFEAQKTWLGANVFDFAWCTVEALENNVRIFCCGNVWWLASWGSLTAFSSQLQFVHLVIMLHIFAWSDCIWCPWLRGCCCATWECCCYSSCECES